MYIRKKDKLLFKELDENLKIPKQFYKYAKQLEKKHRLIIRSSKNGTVTYHCDNCHVEFSSYNKYLIGEEVKCPNCKLKLILKSNKIRKFRFNDQFGILDKYKNYWILRLFDLETNYIDGDYYPALCEYGRKIYDENLLFIHEIFNNNVSTFLSGKFIQHRSFEDNNWKITRSYYSSLGNYYIIYPYNVKDLFKNTKWRYSQMWDLFKKTAEYRDIFNMMNSYSNCFEYLMKLKLYALAEDSLRYSKDLIIKELYPVIKSNLNFVRKNNIDLNELIALNFLREHNIRKIKILSRIDEDILTFFQELKINPDYLIKRIDNYHEYRDYLILCEKLKYNMKDKKILYPDDLFTEHNKAVELYEVIKNEKINKKIHQVYETIVKNSYSKDKYSIFPAASIEELVDESSQQNNCVKTYADRIEVEKCEIYFMRLTSDIKHSLVTVEVRENKIVQKRTKNNERTTNDQNTFLNFWEKNILGGNR